MNKPRIAFLGLGLMGAGMAHRLLGAGFPLAVFNRTRARADAHAAAGARVADSPRAAAEDADVIISMVADDPAARFVWLGEDGALATATPGAICIECSTVTTSWIHELSGAATSHRCGFLDAPVTGSRAQAEAGELNFLVGGDATTLDQVRPVLAAMSRSIVHLGPVGSGALVKLVNNFVCGVQIAALAEAVAMIERSGLERATALGVLTNGAPGSPLVKAVAQRMTTPEYAPNFMVRLMCKDLAYAIAEAANHSLELTTAVAARRAFERGVAEGFGEKDIAAVVEPLRTHLQDRGA